MYEWLKKWFKRPIIYEVDVKKIKVLKKGERLIFQLPQCSAEVAQNFKRQLDKMTKKYPNGHIVTTGNIKIINGKIKNV